MDRAGRLGVLVEGAGLVLVDPDPDQGAGELVAARQAVKRLTSQILLNNLALEVDAVGAVLCHRRRSFECPTPPVKSFQAACPTPGAHSSAGTFLRPR